MSAGPLTDKRFVEASAEFVLLYVDTDLHPETVTTYNIVDLPTLMFLRPDGGTIHRLENEFKDSAVERILEGIRIARDRHHQMQDTELKWQQRLAENPADVEPHNKLGAFYQSMKRFDAARTHVLRAIELDPTAKSDETVFSYLCAAWLHLQDKDYPAAQKKAEAMLAARPQHAEVGQMTFYLGQSLFRQGETDRAKQLWQSVCDRFPGTPWAVRAKAALDWKPE